MPSSADRDSVIATMTATPKRTKTKNLSLNPARTLTKMTKNSKTAKVKMAKNSKMVKMKATMMTAAAS
jgi:hypothetical protein